MNYSEKLKDPRWQKKRLEILDRDKWSCQSCKDKETELHVHHNKYFGANPWEAHNSDMVTLCKPCHLIHEKFKKVYKGSIILSVVKRQPGSSNIIPIIVLMDYKRDDGQMIKGVLFSTYDGKEVETDMLSSFDALHDVVHHFAKMLLLQSGVGPIPQKSTSSLDDIEFDKDKVWRPEQPNAKPDDLPFD